MHLPTRFVHGRPHLVEAIATTPPEQVTTLEVPA
jgi:hypothetical protein